MNNIPTAPDIAYLISNILRIIFFSKFFGDIGIISNFLNVLACVDQMWDALNRNLDCDSYLETIREIYFK